MSYRFEKKVYNAEDGTRTLGFFKPGEENEKYATFNLNILEDLRIEMGDERLALNVTLTLEAMTGFKLTPEEIEYAMEDI